MDDFEPCPHVCARCGGCPYCCPGHDTAPADGVVGTPGGYQRWDFMSSGGLRRGDAI